MGQITDEQYIEMVNNIVPQNYKKFCKKEMFIYIGLSLFNTIWIVDPTGGLSLSFGTVLSFLIQAVYLFRFRNQVIVPFRLTYSLPRKLVSSWTLGLGYAGVFAIVTLFRVIPLIGALAPLGGSALIAFNTFAAYRYHRWQFSRQYEGKSLHWIEWIFMSCLTGAGFVTIALTCVALYQVGVMAEDALAWLQTIFGGE